MKKFVTFGFVIFFMAAAGILFVGIRSTGPKITNPNLINNGAGGSITLSLQEIAKHNSINDCWMILGSKVYNITQDLQIHPAGAGTILSYCGKDGAKGFTTKDVGVGRNHSQNAYALLNNYYLGDIGQTINVGKTNVPTIPPGLIRESDE